MSMNFKKSILLEQTYKPQNIEKHKHDYQIRYLLEITNKNIHASCNYYNKKEYHYVLKCKFCDSFIPDSKEHNFNARIFANEEIDTSLPLIKANTNQKNPNYDFSKLTDVEIE